MEAFDLARLRARAVRDSLVDQQGSCFALVEKALGSLGYKIEPETPAGTGSLLRGDDAQLHHEFKMALVRDDVGRAEQASLLAHELGHLILHRPNEPCELEQGEAGARSRALSKVEVYGPRERRELQANVFSREFLLPRNLARDLFLDQGLSASRIAERIEMPIAEVRRQLLDSLLRPDVVTVIAPSPQAVVLDESQKKAVDFDGPALLVEAGPGSGKTRTLVSRIERRLAEGVHPSEILALTFSNKAAAELSDRVAARRPADAVEVWTGTFHAFGLEIMRKNYERMGLPARVRLISPSQAVEMLEEHLPIMNLVHFRDLRNPAANLKEIMKCIGRAKDELVGPVRFRELAVAGLESARLAEGAASGKGLEEAKKRKVRAEKTLDAATVYDFYDHRLHEERCVDFADLVMRSALLLQEDPEVRTTLQDTYRDVLVDEYQDVNRACAEMVRAVSGGGARVWAVGDARQSIYRFRGASSVNMERFEEDFPGGQRKDLRVNYRSTDHLTSQSRRFASKMDERRSYDGSGTVSPRLPYAAVASTADAGSMTTLHVGRDDACESELIAGQMKELARLGVPFGRQAVLARTNARLDKLAAELADHGVPVLHLGSFFEREEVRDILSVLSLVAEPNGTAVARVAAMKGLAVSGEDLSLAVAAARRGGLRLLESLACLSSISGISPEGIANLQKIASGLVDAKPWMPASAVAMDWLLDRSDYLRHLCAEDGVSADLRRDAVWQLLEFLDQTEPDGRPLSVLEALRRVRTVMLLADDRDLREPGTMPGVDAARLITVHAAKGLEFEAVHVVGLHKNNFPLQHRSASCPVPPGVEDERDPVKAHEEEEDCAFFVAMSRAERHLRLYRTEMAAKQRREPSRFLSDLGLAAEPTLLTTSIGFAKVRPLGSRIAIDRITLGDIRDFERCPLKLRYRYGLGLSGRRAESPFLKASGVIYTLIDRLGGLFVDDRDRQAVVEAEFERIWEERGPAGSLLEPQYRELARTGVADIVRLSLGFGGPLQTTTSIAIDGGSVIVPTPLMSPDGSVARFIELGSVDRSRTRNLAAGMQFQAARLLSDAVRRVEMVSPTATASVEIVRTREEADCDVVAASAVLASIASGELPAKTDPRECMRCAHFHACPATGTTPMAQ